MEKSMISLQGLLTTLILRSTCDMVFIHKNWLKFVNECVAAFTADYKIRHKAWIAYILGKLKSTSKTQVNVKFYELCERARARAHTHKHKNLFLKFTLLRYPGEKQRKKHSCPFLPTEKYTSKMDTTVSPN